ncbi:S-adenosylmethionine:tRNA ribosyltransferase-isomerase, partial [Bacillus thuringiensis]|uniref:S-adenosylmethionine:tRNA ribosyltransferase-isomerase n=1 Tax=Bacillus thuringiensis TaxID=1428 RepID=UPI0016435791
EEEGDKWETVVKRGKGVKEGSVMCFGEGKLKGSWRVSGDEGGGEVEFLYEGMFYEILDEVGEMGLRRYIKERVEDRDGYERVYAKEMG